MVKQIYTILLTVIRKLFSLSTHYLFITAVFYVFSLLFLLTIYLYFCIGEAYAMGHDEDFSTLSPEELETFNQFINTSPERETSSEVHTASQGQTSAQGQAPSQGQAPTQWVITHYRQFYLSEFNPYSPMRSWPARLGALNLQDMHGVIYSGLFDQDSTERVTLPGLIRSLPVGVYQVSGGSEIIIEKLGTKVSITSMTIQDPFNQLCQGFIEDGDNKPLCVNIAKALFEARQGGLREINLRTLEPNGMAEYIIKFASHNGFRSSQRDPEIFRITYTFLDKLAESRR